MDFMDIKIISGTDRPGSNSLIFSNYLKQEYAGQGVGADVISLEDFPIKDVAGGIYGDEPESVVTFRQPVLDADGLIFVIPEYNGGFPGILKLFIDYLPFPEALVKKPICLVGIATGSFGGLRAVEQFQMVLGYRNALAYPERVFIQRFDNEFDAQKGLTDSAKSSLLSSQISGFIDFIKSNS